MDFLCLGWGVSHCVVPQLHLGKHKVRKIKKGETEDQGPLGVTQESQLATALPKMHTHNTNIPCLGLSIPRLRNRIGMRREAPGEERLRATARCIQCKTI